MAGVKSDLPALAVLGVRNVLYCTVVYLIENSKYGLDITIESR
jgi:hypothetical protein